MKLRVAIGADHGGYALKEDLVSWLKDDCEVVDKGAASFDSADDYPDFALAVARAVASGEAKRGVIICGSGVGGSIVANRVAGVRASTCHDTYSAHQGVEHDDMNILCLGARVVGVELAKELVKAFLGARFVNESRFRRRLDKVLEMDRRGLESGGGH